MQKEVYYIGWACVVKMLASSKLQCLAGLDLEDLMGQF